MGTYAANSNILLTSVLEDLGDNTLLLELKVHLRLVGLDLDQDITGGDGVAGLLLPSANVAGRHGGRQGGHLDDGVRRERGVPSCYLGRQVGSEGRGRALQDSPAQHGAEHCGWRFEGREKDLWSDGKSQSDGPEREAPGRVVVGSPVAQPTIMMRKMGGGGKKGKRGWPTERWFGPIVQWWTKETGRPTDGREKIDDAYQAMVGWRDWGGTQRDGQAQQVQQRRRTINGSRINVGAGPGLGLGLNGKLQRGIFSLSRDSETRRGPPLPPKSQLHSRGCRR